MYKALADAIRDAERDGKTLAQVALEAEARDQGKQISEIRGSLQRALVVMRGAIEKGEVGDPERGGAHLAARLATYTRRRVWLVVTPRSFVRIATAHSPKLRSATFLLGLWQCRR